MIDKTMRSTIEQDLITQFGTFSVTIPPSHLTTVTMRTEIGYSMQDIYDKLLQNDENFAHIVVSYPNADLEWVRYSGDLAGQFPIPSLLSEVTPAAGDWTTINGVTTKTFSFTTTEPKISKISIYTKLPAGSTSWMFFELYNPNGILMHKQTIYYTAHSTLGGWIDIDLGFVVRLNPATGLSGTYTVILREEDYGPTPTGINIGKSGANIAYRVYTNKLTRVEGKLSRNIMRLMLFAKDKKVGQQPNVDDFISKIDVLTQLAKAIRERIWSSWINFGLNDVGALTIIDDETDNATPFSSGVMDIFIEGPDFGTVPTETLPLKQLNISDIKNI
jgi:hypothetical protein